MEKHKEHTWINVIVVLSSCSIYGWTLYSIYESPLGLAVLFCVISVVIAMACILYNYSTKDTEALERNICKRLDRNGFHFEKKEGALLVTKTTAAFRYNWLIVITEESNIFMFTIDSGMMISTRLTWMVGVVPQMSSTSITLTLFLWQRKIIFAVAIRHPLATQRIS